MKKQSRKYQALMETARELFWKRGFRKVSVEEICHKALVSKMTFYRYFPDKVGLAKAVYDAEVERGMANFKKIMANESTTPIQKMHELLVLKMEDTNDISTAFLKDFYNNSKFGLLAYAEEKNRQVWDEIIHDIKAAQQKGWFRKDFKPEAFLILTTKLSEIITDESLLQLFNTPQEMIMEISRFFTFGIMPIENEK
jgi:AcrR family transcriptional regulator